MQLREMAEVQEEIDRLWEEILKIREESGICQTFPQKGRAFSLMRELAKKSEEGKKWMLEKIVKIRWRLARIDEREGNLDGAISQLQKAQRLLDNHPEIDQNLRGWIETDFKKLEGGDKNTT